MFQLTLLALIGLSCWLCYRLGIKAGERRAQVVNVNNTNLIDVAVVRAVIEREGWIVIEQPKPQEPRQWRQ